MSGIFGIIKSSGDIDVSSSLNRLIKWNNAFGEDQKSESISENVGLGICADHITNAPVNKTPVIHRDNYVGVIDALIYNREELSSSFGLPLTLSDEEMLFDLINSNNPEHLKYVNGDFAGAIYDSSADKLILFTDHMGVHPLFYYRSSTMAAFSTEVRGLINLPEIPGEINPNFLYKIFNGHITSTPTETEFSDVYVVPSATYITITRSMNGLVYDEHKYWTLGQSKYRFATDKQYIAKMRELITNSVMKRLAVFPGIVGAELSGGLDSGVVDLLISRSGRECVYYSWSFDPKDVPLVDQDERLALLDVCKQENITCNFRSKELGHSKDNIVANHLKLGFSPDAPGRFAFKYAYPLYTNTETICEASQLVSDKGAKVIFSGHGGDEGVSHRCDPYELYFYGEKFHFAKCLWEYNKGVSNRLLKTFRDYRYKVARGPSYHNDPAINTVARAPFLLKSSFNDRYKDYKGTPFYFPHDPLSYIATGATNIRLNVAALFGPYSGARYVFPLLDRDVIDFAVSIPRHLFINKCQKRYIYREAFKDIMPQSLYETTIKITPVEKDEDAREKEDKWFEDTRNMAVELCGLLDKNYWEKYLDYSEIDKLLNAEDPGPEGKESYIAAVNLLSELYQFQNIITKVKAL